MSDDFDPDAYLKAKEAPAFDPDAYLADKARADPSLGQRVTNAAQSAGMAPSMSIGDRLKNAAHLTAGQLPAAGAIGGGALGAGLGGAIGFPTTGPGGIVTTIAGGATGAGLGASGGRLLQRAIDAALGYETAPGVIDATKDALAEGGKNAAMTAAGGAAGEMLSAAAKPTEKALRGVALPMVRRILRNVGGSISAKKTIPEDVLQEVLDVGAVQPLGSSAGTATRLDSAREAIGQRYGEILQKLEAAGITGPNAKALARKYLLREASVSANSMNPSASGVYKTAAEQLASKPTTNGNLSLTQTENLKRSLQDQSQSAYKQMQPNEVGVAHEDAASMMRQATEDEKAQQVQATRAMRRNPAVQEAAAQFEPVKQQAGRLIQASNAAREGMARALNRNALSLNDTIMAGGELAKSGNPLLAAGAGMASKLARERLPSTIAWSANKLANVLGDAPQMSPETATRIGTLLTLLRQNRSEPEQ